MEYQHRVTVWNYETGMKHMGVFRSGAEAEKFRDETTGHEKTYSSMMGDWPYGTFSQSFNVDAHNQRQREWCESHGGVNGRD